MLHAPRRRAPLCRLVGPKGETIPLPKAGFYVFDPAPCIVVVDANVLLRLALRDTVLRAAPGGFSQRRWSAEVLDEMERNLVSTGTMPADKAARLRTPVERYFPDAKVIGYQPLIAAMQNDTKDRHVVAVAVKASAQVLRRA